MDTECFPKMAPRLGSLKITFCMIIIDVDARFKYALSYSDKDLRCPPRMKMTIKSSLDTALGNLSLRLSGSPAFQISGALALCLWRTEVRSSS